MLRDSAAAMRALTASTTFAIVLGAALAGCGIKGPLTLPAAPAASASAPATAPPASSPPASAGESPATAPTDPSARKP
jgi:predicted small lipoprotein YifL